MRRRAKRSKLKQPVTVINLVSLTGTINGTTESASYTYDLQKRLVTSDQTSNGASAQRQIRLRPMGESRRSVGCRSRRGNQIQSVTLEQSGGAPTNRIQTLYPPGNQLSRCHANGATAVCVLHYSSDLSYPSAAAINGRPKRNELGRLAVAGWKDVKERPGLDYRWISMRH